MNPIFCMKVLTYVYFRNISKFSSMSANFCWCQHFCQQNQQNQPKMPCSLASTIKCERFMIGECLTPLMKGNKMCFYKNNTWFTVSGTFLLTSALFLTKMSVFSLNDVMWRHVTSPGQIFTKLSENVPFIHILYVTKYEVNWINS